VTIKRANVWELSGHSSLPINALQLVTVQSWANVAVRAGVPSCWEMKPDGRKDLIIQLVWVTEFKITLAFTLALCGMDNIIIVWVL